MIHHVVLLRFRPEVGDAERAAVQAGLEHLAATIPDIRSYRFGPDAGLAAGNADWAIVAVFDDSAGWARYRDHPEHQRFLTDTLVPLLAERAAVQFEAPAHEPADPGRRATPPSE